MMNRPIGPMIERALFGTINPEVLAKEPNDYTQHRPSLEFVMVNTPWDPQFPKTWFFQRIQHHLVELAKLPDATYVECYTAIGTRLDYWHGVDALLNVRSVSGESIIITIDVTANPSKLFHKADITIHVQKKDDAQSVLDCKAFEIARRAFELLQQRQRARAIMITQRS